MTHQQDNISNPELLDSIMQILIQNGIKSTTMDIVAKRLKISKRTLYEIFVNKADMIAKVFSFHHSKCIKAHEEIFKSAPNVMEALMRMFSYQRDNIARIDIRFFRDLDNLYPEIKAIHDNRHEIYSAESLKIFNLGVEQGVFRDDINFSILLRIMECQTEAIKRTEDIFPPEISIIEIFDTMTIGFLRSIASEKGHKMLDELKSSHYQPLHGNKAFSSAHQAPLTRI